MSLIRRTLVTALVLSLVGAPGTTTGRGLPSLADYPLMVDTAWLWGLSPGAEDPDDPAMPTGMDQPLLVTAAYRCRVSGATPTQVAVAEVIATDPSPQPSASPAA